MTKAGGDGKNDGLGDLLVAAQRGDSDAYRGFLKAIIPFVRAIARRRCWSEGLATSTVLAPVLVWRLARAKPIDPLPVALLGGLGIAGSSAFALQFFHPFTVTFIDLTVHLFAILVVVGTVGLLNRRTLALA